MSDLPQGHIMYEGRRYVAFTLFEAACAHVREQGDYHNQIIATLNAVRQERRELRDANERLGQELGAVRVELSECRQINAAMRKAVYGAAEGL